MPHFPRKSGCPHCKLLNHAEQNTLESKVFENDVSVAIAGDHQFYKGYVVLLSKIHIREMHDLPQEFRQQLFETVLYVGQTLKDQLNPHKLNYASLGNVDEHLHWHIFPRYLGDPNLKNHPWSNTDQFLAHKTTPVDIQFLCTLFSSNFGPFNARI